MLDHGSRRRWFALIGIWVARTRTHAEIADRRARMSLFKGLTDRFENCASAWRSHPLRRTEIPQNPPALADGGKQALFQGLCRWSKQAFQIDTASSWPIN
jgi:hypothetical protein